MNRRVIAIIGSLSVIGACWWFVSSERENRDHVFAATPSLPSAAPPPPQPLPTPAGDVVPSVKTRALPSPEGVDILPAIPLETGELGWELTIRRTLEDKRLTEAQKGRRLLEAIPTLAVEGRETAAEEAIKRIPDSEYRHVQIALSNPATFGTAISVFFSDLMDRPDELRLPTLLAIAQNSEHPYASSARDNLSFVLKQNLGTDWTRWDAAIRQQLAAKAPQ